MLPARIPTHFLNSVSLDLIKFDCEVFSEGRKRFFESLSYFQNWVPWNLDVKHDTIGNYNLFIDSLVKLVTFRKQHFLYILYDDEMNLPDYSINNSFVTIIIASNEV